MGEKTAHKTLLTADGSRLIKYCSQLTADGSQIQVVAGDLPIAKIPLCPPDVTSGGKIKRGICSGACLPPGREFTLKGNNVH